MKWSDVTRTIGEYAPLIGSVIGGPAGAGVGALVASTLGVENTPAAVQAALGNPESIVKLRELESAERQHLLAMQVETLKLELNDTQSARQAHVNSVMPNIVTISLTIICGVLLYSLLFLEIPPNNRDILIQSFGTTLGFWGASIAYWVGTTRSSHNKTVMLGGINERTDVRA